MADVVTIIEEQPPQPGGTTTIVVVQSQPDQGNPAPPATTGGPFLEIAQNLADVADATEARMNLDISAENTPVATTAYISAANQQDWDEQIEQLVKPHAFIEDASAAMNLTEHFFGGGQPDTSSLTVATTDYDISAGSGTANSTLQDVNGAVWGPTVQGQINNNFADVGQKIKDLRTDLVNLVDGIDALAFPTIGELGWWARTANSGEIVSSTGSEIPSAGRLVLATGGVSASGSAMVVLGHDAYGISGAPVFRYSFRIKVTTIATVGDQFSTFVGLNNRFASTSSALNTGFWFVLPPSTTNSGQWRCLFADGSTTTTVDTSTAPEADTWVTIACECDGGGTVRYYIDDMDTAVVTGYDTTSTPFPTGGSDQFTPMVCIVKSSGTADRRVSVDQFTIRYEHGAQT